MAALECHDGNIGTEGFSPVGAYKAPISYSSSQLLSESEAVTLLASKMPATTTSFADAKLLFLRAQALYIGPSLGLSAHRNAVAVLCVGIGGHFEVATNPRDPTAKCVRCATALIPPNTLNRLDITSSPMAFFYLDPQSVHWPVLRSAMRHDYGSFSTEIDDEVSVLDSFSKIAAGQLSMTQACALLHTALALRVPLNQDDRIVEILRRIRESPTGANSLQSLAATVGLSSSRFLHLFKETTGVPLRRYRIWNRMGSAVRHIVAGMSLTDAALTAGFSSSAHFSAAFRDMFGMPPNKLIEMHLTISADG